MTTPTVGVFRSWSTNTTTVNNIMNKPKVFNDSIHGHIELHALSVKIIDTFEYQRLRDLKQLGGAYTVFPAASHNRFEHCLGVAHLARRFVTHLATVQPELQITASDALCVEIAGLIHDLGHGILSHLFDAKFIPAIIPDCEWEHEHASTDMFDYLIKRNHLLPYFMQAGLVPEDIHFIKELVYGSPKDAPKHWVWQGRGDKTFLYEIIANKRNGIDVDKWDYFQRDCRQLNMSVPFDAQRLMKFARVLRGFDNVLQIAYPVKEAWHVYQMFQARYSLHKRAYQHKVARVIESMYMEALIAADPFITVPAGEGVRNPDGSVTVPRLRMSQAIYDMGAYSRLSDYLLRTIACSVQPDLAKARHIIHRILQRDIYSWVGETILPVYEIVPEGTGLGNSFHHRYGNHGSSHHLSAMVAENSAGITTAVGIVPIPSPSSSGLSSTVSGTEPGLQSSASSSSSSSGNASIPNVLIGPDGFPHRLGQSTIPSPNNVLIVTDSTLGEGSSKGKKDPPSGTEGSTLTSSISSSSVAVSTTVKPTTAATATTNKSTVSSSSTVVPPTVNRLRAVDGKLVLGTVASSTHKATKVPRIGSHHTDKDGSTSPGIDNTHNPTMDEDTDNDIGIPLSQIAVVPITRTKSLPVTPPLDIEDIDHPKNNNNNTDTNTDHLLLPSDTAFHPVRRFKARRALKEADRLEITDILVDIAGKLTTTEIEEAWLRYGYVQTPRAQYKRLLSSTNNSSNSTTTNDIPKFSIPNDDHTNVHPLSSSASTGMHDTSSIISHSDDEDDSDNDNHHHPSFDDNTPADIVMNKWLKYSKEQHKNQGYSNGNDTHENHPYRSGTQEFDILNADAEKFRVPTPNQPLSQRTPSTHNQHTNQINNPLDTSSLSNDWSHWLTTTQTTSTQNTTTTQSIPYHETLTADDILVDIVTINYGMGNKDPVEKVLFYEVDKRTGELTPTKVKPNQVSVFVPSTFEEQYVRLYVKRKSIRHLATAAFDRWCTRARTSSPTVFSPARKPKRKRSFDNTNNPHGNASNTYHGSSNNTMVGDAL